MIAKIDSSNHRLHLFQEGKKNNNNEPDCKQISRQPIRKLLTIRILHIHGPEKHQQTLAHFFSFLLLFFFNFPKLLPICFPLPPFIPSLFLFYFIFNFYFFNENYRSALQKKKGGSPSALCHTGSRGGNQEKTSPIVLYTCCLLWCVVLRCLVAAVVV